MITRLKRSNPPMPGLLKLSQCKPVLAVRVVSFASKDVLARYVFTARLFFTTVLECERTARDLKEARARARLDSGFLSDIIERALYSYV